MIKHLASVAIFVAITFGGGGPRLASRGVEAPSRVSQANDDFQGTLTSVEAAQVEFARGRPAAFKALWSHDDNVTLSGGLGGVIEKGWERVSRRIDWASSQFAEGTRTPQEIARHVNGNLAYVVQLETIRYRAPASGRDSVQELRATMVFRREPRGWLIVHRHADSQTSRQPQPDVRVRATQD
jgi:ketosteroid isomerase-like protein